VLERVLHVIELVRLHDRDDELHDVSKSTVRPALAPTGSASVGTCPMLERCNTKSGYARTPNSGTSRPSISASSDTRIFMKRFAIEKMIHVIPQAQMNPTNTWAIWAHSCPTSP